MRRSRRGAWALWLSCALAVLAAACGGAKEGHSRGTVTAVDVEARTVTLDHEDVPGLMKAMTMTFDVAPGVPLDDLQPGAQVEFVLAEEGGAYTVTEIVTSGP